MHDDGAYPQFVQLVNTSPDVRAHRQTIYSSYKNEWLVESPIYANNSNSN